MIVKSLKKLSGKLLLFRRLELLRALIAFLFFFSNFLLFSQDANNLFRVGYSSFNDGFYLSAIGNFEEYLKYYPTGSNADDARYMLGISYYYTGKYSMVVNSVDALLAISPSSKYVPRVYYWKGMALYKLKKYKRALKSFNLLLETYKPLDFYYLYSLFYKAKSLEGLNRNSEALITLREMLNRLASAANSLGPVSKETLSQYILNELGSVSFKLGEYETSSKYYSRIILDYPNSPFIERAVFYMAECDFYLNDYENARKRYTRLLALFPKTQFEELAIYRLAYISNVLNRWNDALRYIARYKREFPRGAYFVDIKRVEGDVFLALERYEDALVVYRYLLSGGRISKVERQKVEYNMGLCYKNLNKYSEALRYFREVSSGATGEVKKRAMFNEALALYRLNRANEAEELFKKLLRVYGKQDERIGEDILGWIANIYESKGELDKAYAAWNDLITRYPDSLKIADYYYHRGNVSLKLGRYDAALRDFDMIKMHYNSQGYIPQVDYQIGYIYALKGEYVRAIGFFKSALGESNSEAFSLKCEYSIASGYYNIGDDGSAMRYFEMVVENPGKEKWDGKKNLIAESYFNMGKIYYRARKYRLAAENFYKASQVYGVGFEAAKSLMWKGWGEFQLGDYSTSEKTFYGVAKEFENLPGVVVEALYRAGISASQRGDFEKALNYFNSALGVLNRIKNSVTYIGIENIDIKEMERGILYSTLDSYVSLGNVKKIRSSVGRLYQLFPESKTTSNALFRVAKFFYNKKDYRVARLYFKKIIENFNGDNREFSLYWDGMCCLKLEDFAGAVERFMHYLSLYPEGVFKEESLVSLGTALERAGDKALVESVYSKTISSKLMDRRVRDTIVLYYALFIYGSEMKKSVNLLMNLAREGSDEDIRTRAELALARYYEREGDLEKAMNIFEVISEKRSDVLGARAEMGLAKLFESHGKIQKAIESYLKIDYLYGSYSDIASEALYRLYLIYKRLGSPQKAKQVYSKLVERYPDSKWIERINEGVKTD